MFKRKAHQMLIDSAKRRLDRLFTLIPRFHHEEIERLVTSATGKAKARNGHDRLHVFALFFQNILGQRGKRFFGDIKGGVTWINNLPKRKPLVLFWQEARWNGFKEKSNAHKHDQKTHYKTFRTSYRTANAFLIRLISTVKETVKAIH